MTTRPLPTPASVWQQARTDQLAGHIDAARTGFLQVLQHSPEHPDVLLALATLAADSGQSSEALNWYERLLRSNADDSANVHLDIARILLRLNKAEVAINHLQRAINLQPKDVAVHELLADTCLAQDRLDDAITAYEQALVLTPKSSTIFCKLGYVYLQQGELNEAEDCFQRACILDQETAEPWLNLGILHFSRQQYQQALADFDQALRRNPDETDGHLNRALTLQALDRLADAEQAFRDLIKQQPLLPAAHLGLANILTLQGHGEQADTSYSQAVNLQPDHAEAWCAWGDALFGRNLHDQAASKYRQALALQPGLTRAQFHLGLVYHDQDKLHDALHALQKTVALQPDLVLAHVKMAAVLDELGRYGEERLAYRQAIKLDPGCMMAHSGLLFSLGDDPKCSPADYLQQAAVFSQSALALAQPYQDWPALQQWRPGAPLRIGFVSGDLRRHPVGYFLESLLAHIDHSRFELVAYSIQPLEDEMTARLKPYFSAWRSLPMLAMDDATAAQQIHDDNIHILIDLGGHTRFNRLSTFAWKPAPVQLSWLGYFASTAAPGMDYVLVDPVSAPLAHQAHFTEQLLYLPETRLCFSPPAEAQALAPAAAPVLDNGHLTFGCFQNLRKINDRVLALWSRVLAAIPASTLLIKNKQLQDSETRQTFVRQLADAGIARERVIMEGESSYRDYLEAYADVDLMLDTFPFPGGTTTCEALWMGVPTLTLTGDRLIGLQGASMLSCVGLPEWIAVDEDDYVAKAVALSADTAALAQLRSGLRARMADSALIDGARFARHFESALEQAWDKRRTTLMAANTGSSGLTRQPNQTNS